ncbi:MAG: hypothetical protein FWE46_00495 [Coriobacteriia bacterium]|nr:hypothetical protein [Coriobacteriia bacterium]MCL2536747.1 hypothetical protein [Coriobacteriia bacterium]
MTTELVIIMPAVLLALVIIVNLGMFFAEAARFDRIVCEVARIMVTSAVDPSVAASTTLHDSLSYPAGKRGPYRASVVVSARNELGLQPRTLQFRLEYELFGLSFLAQTGIAHSPVLRRTKTLTVYWSSGL